MNIRAWLVALAVCIGTGGCASSPPVETQNVFAALLQRHDIVDLTHTLDKDFPYIPIPGITFPFALEPIATMERDHVAANAWRVHEHMGTQIDAPNHFSKGGHGMDALAAHDLIAPIVVIDYRREGVADRDAALSVDQLKAWEAKHGRIPVGSVVALYTGWDRKIGDAAYIGLDNQHVKHFPGFSPESIQFLVRERDVWGVAVDTLSFDPGVDGTYQAHRALLGAGKWALEALANLDRLPPTGATIFIGAPKVRDATGSIARAIALVPKEPQAAANLEGRWRSSGMETLRTAPGRAVYLTRNFTFAQDRWSIEFTLYSDSAGQTPILRGTNSGRFVMGSRLRLAEASEADFFFESRTLIPLSEDTAAALTAAGCGAKPWRVGQAQDVTQAGCQAFRVPPLDRCPREYDVVRLAADQLYLGARPATGDLCSLSMRPDFPGQAALQRVR